MSIHKSNIAFLLILIAGLLTLAALILAVGLAFGSVINWLLPSLGLGVSSILALVTVVIMGQLVAIVMRLTDFAQAFSASSRTVQYEDKFEDEEEYEPELLSEEQVEFVADQLSEAVIARLLAAGSEKQSARAKHRFRR